MSPARYGGREEEPLRARDGSCTADGRAMAILGSSLWFVTVLSFVSGGCVVSSRNQARGLGRQRAQDTSAPVMPPASPSDEATAAQLQLAREQGHAVERALAWWQSHGAWASGQVGAGEYQIAYALRRPSGTWSPEGSPGAAGPLTWKPDPGNVLLAVVVRDGADGRIVPGLEILATVLRDGAVVTRAPLPLRWDAPLTTQASSLMLPPGTYRIRLDIAPPTWPRHDPTNGDRFGSPVVADLGDLSFTPSPSDKSDAAADTEDDEVDLALASAQGDALAEAFREMSRNVANSSAELRVGDYRVACAVEYAETSWVMNHDHLAYDPRSEQSTETNAHLEVGVFDAMTGRFLPGLQVRATIVDGANVGEGTKDVAFMWHPWLYHYGRNWRVPHAGLYRVQVHVDPPPWSRAGAQRGRRFAEPIDVEFPEVRIETGQK